ncbi:MAG: glycosyltransferase [bacterium]
MTVVHSTSLWLPVTQNWQYTQIRFLPPRIESHIVCRRTRNLEQFALPNIHSLSENFRLRLFWDKRFLNPRMQFYIGFLAESVKRHKASILHSHFGYRGWLDLHVAEKCGVKHAVTFYGADLGKYLSMDPRWRGRYREMFEQVEAVLCEGPHMAGLVKELGCPKRKVRVHHLGVDVDGIKFQSRKWAKPEPLRVLIAASFREKKGIPCALEALGALRRDVELEITIIGDAADNASGRAEKKKILSVIEKHNLQSKVRMMGYQPHSVLFEEAYKHHVFLSPSVKASDGDIEGGAPVSIIEMAATGMPVVSTKHCDIPHVIHHGASGLLAAERDVDDLVNHLKWLIENPGQWDTMARSARKHVETNFNARRQGQELAAVYQAIIDS